MCVAQAMGVLGQGGLLETLGDPLGTKRARDDEQKNRWAREDAIRDATFAHEEKMAGFNQNRNSLNVPAPGTGITGTTGTPTNTRGGGRSRSGRGTAGGM